MNQEQASTRVISLKVRLVRQVALLGAPLLLLSSVIWPGFRGDQGTLAAVVLLLVGLLTYFDRSVRLHHPKNLAIIMAVIIFIASGAGFFLWREGTIVAEARFNPGIAPFDITVRKVPVPVTHSSHFIVALKRGQYPVTSFRYFWIAYTPEKVRIEWTRLETFKVIFDERYTATCNWTWGREATWTMEVPLRAQAPGDQP